MDAGPEEALRRRSGSINPARTSRFPTSVRNALWLLPILTGLAASTIILALHWLFESTNEWLFWERGLGEFVSVLIPFAAGSILFTLGPCPLLLLAPVVPPDQARLIRWMGITFFAWGTVVAAMTACSFGFFCALMCAIVLHHTSGSRWQAILPIANLAPAWAIALATGDISGSDSFTKSSTLAVAAWNVLAAIELAAWVAALRASRPFDGECPDCRYDRRDLPHGVPCPECGTALPPVEAGAWRKHVPHPIEPSAIVRQRST
jgi:hypothetical protein